MVKQHTYKFLSAGIESESPATVRKVVLSNLFFSIMIFMSLLACVLNLWLSYSLRLALLDAIAACTAIIAMVDIQKNHALDRAINLTTANLFVFLLLFIFFNGAKEFGLIWTIFFPIFAIPLLGHKKGLLVSGVYYLILFSLAYASIGVWEDWDLKAFIRFLLASMLLTALTCIYEIVLNHADTEIETIRNKEADYIEELRRMAVTDTLTGLYNRRKINEILVENLHNARRYEEVFSLILFDIDDFKHVNDTYGHNVGDIVLVTLAKLVSNRLRKTDYFGRWGGEEFLIVLPKTSQEDAFEITNSLRLEIQTIIFAEHFSVTCSFGVSQFEPTLELSTLINNADKALYVAKNNGKNQVCLWSEQ